jgi:hypothetical protein
MVKDLNVLRALFFISQYGLTGLEEDTGHPVTVSVKNKKVTLRCKIKKGVFLAHGIGTAQSL